MDTRYFVPNSVQVKVKSQDGKTTYKVGELRPTALDIAYRFALSSAWRFDSEEMGFVRERDENGNELTRGSYPATDDSKLYLQRSFFVDNYGQIIAVLAANVGESLTVARLVDMAIDEPETLEMLYQTAIKLNPTLAFDYKAGTQAEALNDEGELKRQEETGPLG